MRIDLIYLTRQGQQLPIWPAGKVWPVDPAPAAVAAVCQEALQESEAAHFLFWGEGLPLPEPRAMSITAQQPGDVWHAGLLLEQAGRPRLLDFVKPVWRFNRDPQAERPATSWRLSLHACLARREVLETLGGPAPDFDTLSGAALDLGHRWILNGVFVQHEPSLLTSSHAGLGPPPSPADEFTFIRRGYGEKWVLWALLRTLANGYGVCKMTRAWWRAQRRSGGQVYTGGDLKQSGRDRKLERDSWPSVSVLIPTLDRYPYLFQLLDQLRDQSVRPLEIIVVDQTPAPQRQPDWPQQFSDLPLNVIWREQAGQCSSRNAGLQAARGETILFLDDDDEVPPDLIATHLDYLMRRDLDASCGVAEEAGAGPLPPEFYYPRASDVFPTNNTLLKKQALRDVGLFDLAFDIGERSDADLGMRLYLAGKRLGLNPDASVLHWHAPRGGLRTHRARAVTRGGSRATVWQRHLLAPTEGYLWARYFTPRQVREALLIRTLSTLGGSGKGLWCLLRLLLMFLLLPDSYLRNRARLREGRHMLDKYPIIPQLEKCEGADATVGDDI